MSPVGTVEPIVMRGMHSINGMLANVWTLSVVFKRKFAITFTRLCPAPGPRPQDPSPASGEGELVSAPFDLRLGVASRRAGGQVRLVELRSVRHGVPVQLGAVAGYSDGCLAVKFRQCAPRKLRLQHGAPCRAVGKCLIAFLSVGMTFLQAFQMESSLFSGGRA